MSNKDKHKIIQELVEAEYFSIAQLIGHQDELNIHSPEVLWEMFDKILDKRARRSLVFR